MNSAMRAKQSSNKKKSSEKSTLPIYKKRSIPKPQNKGHVKSNFMKTIPHLKAQNIKPAKLDFTTNPGSFMLSNTSSQTIFNQNSRDLSHKFKVTNQPRSFKKPSIQNVQNLLHGMKHAKLEKAE